MKKLSILLLAAIINTACGSQNNHDGTYVSHSEGIYSIADDTLIIRDGIVTQRTGYQKIRNDQLRPKAYKVRRWYLNNQFAPVIQFADGKLFLGETTYKKLL